MRPDGAPGLLVVPPAFTPDRSLGWQVAHFAETFLCHGPGDVQGDPLVHDEEILGFYVMAYGLAGNGRRLVNYATLSRLKGRSKSEVAGETVCIEFIGPARFDHWAVKGEESWWGYKYEPGEPVGRPVRSPFIRCLATEEEQSGNTYDNVTVMLEHAQLRWPEHFGGIDMGRSSQSSTRIFKAGGGEIRPSTASSASKDGGKESFAVEDEVHLYKTPELRQMDKTVGRNCTKRPAAEPWLLRTTTMYEPGENSVGEIVHGEAQAIATAKRPNRGLLFDHREGPPVKEWEDDAEVAASVKVAAGAATWIVDNVERILSEIRDPRTSRADGERYFLNRATKGERQAIDPEVWTARGNSSRKVEPGEEIGLGFDGSISGDATFLTGCTRDGFSFVIASWERPHGPRGVGWKVPRLEVDEVVRETFSTYKVGRMFCDPPKWWSEIEAWALVFGEDVVLALETNSARRFAPACGRWVTALEEGTHTHEDSPVLTSHVLAMARKNVRLRDTDDDGRTQFVFVKADTRKIDGGIADVLAHEAAATMPEIVRKKPATLVSF